MSQSNFLSYALIHRDDPWQCVIDDRQETVRKYIRSKMRNLMSATEDVIPIILEFLVQIELAYDTRCMVPFDILQKEIRVCSPCPVYRLEDSYVSVYWIKQEYIQTMDEPKGKIILLNDYNQPTTRYCVFCLATSRDFTDWEGDIRADHRDRPCNCHAELPEDEKFRKAERVFNKMLLYTVPE